MFDRFRKKSGSPTPRDVRRKRRRELIAVLIVGLVVAAIVGYVIYKTNAKHP